MTETCGCYTPQECDRLGHATPTTPTPADLRALLEAGTPGPWEVATDDHGRKGVDVGIWSESASRYPVETLVIGNPNHAADAALITAAVNALPGLLDLRERVEALLARLEAWDGSGGIDNPDSSSGTERARLRALLAETSGL